MLFTSHNRRATKVIETAVAAAIVTGITCTTVSATATATASLAAAHRVSATTEPAPFDERVIAIGEEFLLANLLAIGVVPVASTATVASGGFLGLDEFDANATDAAQADSGTYDLDGIEILPFPGLSLEQLGAIEADHIVIFERIVELAGGATELAAIAPLVIIPDGLTPEEQLQFVAAELGRTEQAQPWLDALATARAAAREQLAGCTVSLTTIYAGPSPAIYTDERSPIPAAVIDAGCTLVPGVGADGAPVAGADGNGRIYISLEQLGMLAAPQLMIISTDAVDGERAAIDEVQSSLLWDTLPAVIAGNVTEVERLGFPGVPGQIRLYDTLAAQLDGNL